MTNQTCCPKGYNYIVNAAFPNGTCQSFYAPFIYTEAIDCPCCPPGYTWNPTFTVLNETGFCVSDTIAGDYTTSIPCITCVCTTIAPFSCPTCGSNGIRIKFVYNFFTKNCTNCVPTQFTPPKGKINCFLPNTFTSPDPTGFQLK